MAHCQPDQFRYWQSPDHYLGPFGLRQGPAPVDPQSMTPRGVPGKSPCQGASWASCAMNVLFAIHCLHGRMVGLSGPEQCHGYKCYARSGGIAARAMNCGQAKPGTTTCYYDYKYQTCYAYSCSHWLSEEGRGRKAIRSHPDAQPNKPAN